VNSTSAVFENCFLQSRLPAVADCFARSCDALGLPCVPLALRTGSGLGGSASALGRGWEREEEARGPVTPSWLASCLYPWPPPRNPWVHLQQHLPERDVCLIWADFFKIEKLDFLFQHIISQDELVSKNRKYSLDSVVTSRLEHPVNTFIQCVCSWLNWVM